MRSFFLAVFLIALTAAPVARAGDPLSILRVEATSEHDPETKTEISIVNVDRSQLALAAEWIRQNLRETLRHNPNAKPIIMLGLSDSPALSRWSEDLADQALESKDSRIRKLLRSTTRIARERLPPELDHALNEAFPGWVSKNKNRLTLTLQRGFLNGTATWISFAVTPAMAWPAALVVGSVVMTMSGTLQFKNKAFMAFLLNTHLLTRAARIDQQELKAIREKIERKEALTEKEEKIDRLASRLEKTEMFLRWASIEAVFLGAVHLTLALLGHPLPGARELAIELRNLVVINVGSQAPWDITIARTRENALATATSEKEVEEIDLRADKATVASSLASVGLSMLKVAGFPKIAYVGFALFGGSGFIKLSRLAAPVAKPVAAGGRCRALYF